MSPTTLSREDPSIIHRGESKIAHCKECERAILKITRRRKANG